MADQATQADAIADALPDQPNSEATDEQPTEEVTETPEPKEAGGDTKDVTEAPAEEATEEAAEGTEEEGDAEGQEQDLNPNSKGYYERKLKEKDEAIASMESVLKEYVQGGADEVDQRLRAVEAREYLSTVKSARESIVSDHDKIQNEVPMFNPTSPEYNERAHQKALRDYAEGFTQVDAQGEIIGYKRPLYDYLKEEADLLNEVVQSGAKKGQQAEATMRGKASVPGANQTPSADEDDPFLKGFDKA